MKLGKSMPSFIVDHAYCGLKRDCPMLCPSAGEGGDGVRGEGRMGGRPQIPQICHLQVYFIRNYSMHKHNYTF